MDTSNQDIPRDSQNSKSVNAFDVQWQEINEPSKDRDAKWWSGSCEAQVAFFIEARTRTLIDEFSRAPGKRILHCGCGTGQWSVPFAERGFHITNVDLSDTALSLTRAKFLERNLEGEFRKADMNHLPFESGSFDIVMSFGVLEHFEDIDRPHSEMARVLKPGGVFFADVIPRRYSIRTLEQVIHGVTALIFYLLTLRWRSLPKAFSTFNPPYFENAYPIEAYIAAIRNSGLSQVRVCGTRAFPFLVLPKFLDAFYALFLRALSKAFGLAGSYGFKPPFRWCAILTYFARK